MKTKTIFNLLAFAMLTAAMVLTTACSGSDDIAVNKPETTEPIAKKGYELPVTVNVTRQGDDATRASYTDNGNGTGSLSFSTGDQLFVEGPDNGGAGQFAGTLTWQSGGTFSGTIYTQNPYSGTADELFSAAASNATLLPNGFQSTGFLSINNNSTTDIAYDDEAFPIFNEAFVASETAKATGVEQLSFEQASTYSDGFALAPVCAILNFTISGLEAGEKAVSLLIHRGTSEYTVTGSVTPNASGVATFAIGVPGGANIKDMDNNLTVGTHNFTLPSSTTFAAGKIYNITRSAAIPGVLNGQFSVSATKQVNFSKGNLRYASGTWSFFDNQYDYYTSYSADAWDKFGWSTSATTYGMNTSTSISDYSGDFVDWGATMGTGWFTLSSAEWTYLFNTRSASNGRYAKAKVNNVQGVILFPDTYTHPDGVTAPTGVNAKDDTGWNGNNYSSADWTKMESAGCVFLPAAGRRNGSSVDYVGSNGDYWSSTALNTISAYDVYFSSGGLSADDYYSRSIGYSVRLVREVE